MVLALGRSDLGVPVATLLSARTGVTMKRAPFGEHAVTQVFLGLLALATTSLVLSSHDLGSGQLPTAMGIACIKAVLIALIFIGVALARPSQIIAVIIAVVMSSAMIGLVIMDVMTR